jgi:hypothetical protein
MSAAATQKERSHLFHVFLPMAPKVRKFGEFDFWSNNKSILWSLSEPGLPTQRQIITLRRIGSRMAASIGGLFPSMKPHDASLHDKRS